MIQVHTQKIAPQFFFLLKLKNLRFINLQQNNYKIRQFLQPNKP